MLAGINRSLFATADDELRPVMNGIYFDITTEDITFVASDGHKLVRNKTFVAHGDEKAAFILLQETGNPAGRTCCRKNKEMCKLILTTVTLRLH